MRKSRKKEAPELESFAVGPLPIINHFLTRLRLRPILGAYLSAFRRRSPVPSAEALGVLLRNLLVSRQPLYAVGAWAATFDPSLLGLTRQQIRGLNDDRIGRALVDLFDADRPSLVLRLVVQAIREFDLSLSEFHQDSTTISFHGLYRLADGRSRRGKPTLKITHGHTKDHRPDLKQLLWSLTVTQDGAVPVNYEVLDGNTTDDQLHRATWDVLRQLKGDADFLYVADSKLCTRSNLLYIDGQEGRFLTMLPATRKEERRFRDWMQGHEVPWQEVLRRRNPSRKGDPPDIFGAYEDPAGSVEGFRIVWYHTTEKEKRDRQAREEKIDRAVRGLQDLRDRLASPRTRLRRRDKVDKAVEEILDATGAHRWLEVQVQRLEDPDYKQTKPGRPGPDTTYRRTTRLRYDVAWKPREENLRYDSKTDGIFPLITNDADRSPKRLLEAYKLGQPRVEQRHHHLKAFHEVAPQYLKSVVRIEAFLCVYFLALLVNALIERELRLGMKRRRVRALPLYPEGRRCKYPTLKQVLEVFDNLRVHRLREAGEALPIHVYQPGLSALQRRALRVLGVPASVYRFQT